MYDTIAQKYIELARRVPQKYYPTGIYLGNKEVDLLAQEMEWSKPNLASPENLAAQMRAGHSILQLVCGPLRVFFVDVPEWIDFSWHRGNLPKEEVVVDRYSI